MDSASGPGVGFITFPELSWWRFEDGSEVVEIGQRVSCEFAERARVGAGGDSG